MPRRARRPGTGFATETEIEAHGLSVEGLLEGEHFNPAQLPPLRSLLPEIERPGGAGEVVGDVLRVLELRDRAAGGEDQSQIAPRHDAPDIDGELADRMGPLHTPLVAG